MRVFAAIELPEEIARVASACQARLKEIVPENSIRWVKMEHLHLTLEFFGEIDPAQIGEMSNAIQEACGSISALSLSLTKGGSFPPGKHPSVIWLGLSGDLAQLEKLQTAIVRGTSIIRRESSPSRAFSPHLTIGRVKNLRPRDSVLLTAALESQSFVQSWCVNQVAFISSQLTPQGPIYRTISVAALH